MTVRIVKISVRAEVQSFSAVNRMMISEIRLMKTEGEMLPTE